MIPERRKGPRETGTTILHKGGEVDKGKTGANTYRTRGWGFLKRMFFAEETFTQEKRFFRQKKRSRDLLKGHPKVSPMFPQKRSACRGRGKKNTTKERERRER